MISFIILLASTVLCCSYCLHRFHVVKIKLMLFDKDVGIDGDYIEKYLNYKPWREPKSRQLKVHYKSWAESWQEISRNDSDCTIYQYSIPERRSNFGATRLNEVWMWPWLWSKIKAERLSIIQKHFDSELNSVPVQEHMELDNFYSEFDMPVRWGLLRLKELEVINILILWIAFWTNFHGIKPTDLGVRPDGSVRTCSVERHNCISSSNEETDVEHYAPPFRWSRSKSPEQVFRLLIFKLGTIFIIAMLFTW